MVWIMLHPPSRHVSISVDHGIRLGYCNGTSSSLPVTLSAIVGQNHMFFQKIRNTHLEDTKWQLQSVHVSCQLKWCQPGCLANGFSCSGSCWNSPSIATWMELGRACKLFIFVGCLIMHRSRIHHALTSKGFWQH